MPAPLMLTELKYEGTFKNLFAAQAAEVEGKKQKNLSGGYAAQCPDGFVLYSVLTHTVYHHSHGENGTLYMQQSLDAGMLYAGTLSVPDSLAGQALERMLHIAYYDDNGRDAHA